MEPIITSSKKSGTHMFIFHHACVEYYTLLLYEGKDHCYWNLDENLFVLSFFNSGQIFVMHYLWKQSGTTWATHHPCKNI